MSGTLRPPAVLALVAVISVIGASCGSNAENQFEYGVTKIPSSNQPGGMTVLNAAMDKCGKLLGEAAGGQG